MTSAGLPDDTIFALASAPGRAGVAVVRVSGPGSESALEQLLDGKANSNGSDLGRNALPKKVAHRPLEARRAYVRKLWSPVDKELLDEALVIWFPGPASFTGEDVAELHLHGGRAVIEAVLAALDQLPGFRMAEPGEFTKRAFYNGRLDLTQAEAIADLVDAETADQKHQALRQAGGELGRLYDAWRDDLVRALSHLEASIDFSDEDIPEDVDLAAKRDLVSLHAQIGDHLNDGRRGERLRSGVQVALLGSPNAGKSTLLNVLVGRDAAIVSATAGTTRDVVEVHIDLAGRPVTLADTAGLRESADDIEREGVKRASLRAEQADLKVIVLDRMEWPDVPTRVKALIDADALVVLNKSDLGLEVDDLHIAGQRILTMSAKTGVGVDAFLKALSGRIGDLACVGGDPALTRQRHRLALEEAHAALEGALADWDAAGSELVAENVRLAARAIGRITGRVDVEDLLDVIFSEFCIGK